MILLQTIPDYVDIDFLKKQLLQQFPEIVNIHDFHVWELTGNKVISTVHMIFQNPKVTKPKWTYGDLNKTISGLRKYIERRKRLLNW